MSGEMIRWRIVRRGLGRALLINTFNGHNLRLLYLSIRSPNLAVYITNITHGAVTQKMLVCALMSIFSRLVKQIMNEWQSDTRKQCQCYCELSDKFPASREKMFAGNTPLTTCFLPTHAVSAQKVIILWLLSNHCVCVASRWRGGGQNVRRIGVTRKTSGNWQESVNSGGVMQVITCQTCFMSLQEW